MGQLERAKIEKGEAGIKLTKDEMEIIKSSTLAYIERVQAGEGGPADIMVMSDMIRLLLDYF